MSERPRRRKPRTPTVQYWPLNYAGEELGGYFQTEEEAEDDIARLGVTHPEQGPFRIEVRNAPAQGVPTDDQL